MTIYSRGSDPAADAARYDVAVETAARRAMLLPGMADCTNCGHVFRLGDNLYRTPIQGVGMSLQCSRRCHGQVWREEARERLKAKRKKQGTA